MRRAQHIRSRAHAARRIQLAWNILLARRAIASQAAALVAIETAEAASRAAEAAARSAAAMAATRGGAIRTIQRAARTRAQRLADKAAEAADFRLAAQRRLRLMEMQWDAGRGDVAPYQATAQQCQQRQQHRRGEGGALGDAALRLESTRAKREAIQRKREGIERVVAERRQRSGHDGRLPHGRDPVSRRRSRARSGY